MRFDVGRAIARAEALTAVVRSSEGQVVAEPHALATNQHGRARRERSAAPRVGRPQVRARLRRCCRALSRCFRARSLSAVQRLNTKVGDTPLHFVHSISSGEAHHPPVVLLPGYGAGAAFWWRTLQPLASAGFQAHAVDWLGTGLSGRPAWSASNHDDSVAFFTDGLEAWRAAAGVESFVLVGHSLGGYLGARYALAHPTRVSKLVLVCPAGVAARSTPPPDSYLYRLVAKAWDAGVTPGAVVRALGPLAPGAIFFFFPMNSSFLAHFDCVPQGGRSHTPPAASRAAPTRTRRFHRWNRPRSVRSIIYFKFFNSDLLRCSPRRLPAAHPQRRRQRRAGAAAPAGPGCLGARTADVRLCAPQSAGGFHLRRTRLDGRASCVLCVCVSQPIWLRMTLFSSPFRRSAHARRLFAAVASRRGGGGRRARRGRGRVAAAAAAERAVRGATQNFLSPRRSDLIFLSPPFPELSYPYIERPDAFHAELMRVLNAGDGQVQTDGERAEQAAREQRGGVE